MAGPIHNGASKRSNPFARSATSTSPATGSGTGRPLSAAFSSPPATTKNPSPHGRTQSHSSLPTTLLPVSNSTSRTLHSSKSNASSTFAPSFIKTEDMRRGSETVVGIEGENDFSGKRYVWLKDPSLAFVRGWIVEELSNNQILVQCDDGSVRN